MLQINEPGQTEENQEVFWSPRTIHWHSNKSDSLMRLLDILWLLDLKLAWKKCQQFHWQEVGKSEEFY